MRKSLSFLAAGAALACAALLFRDRVAVERTISDRPIQVPLERYISSETCRSCHPSQYATWHASYHRTMTQVATPATVTANFNSVRVDAVPGRPMFLERRGGRLWAELDEPDWDGTGGAPARIQRQVVMATGSHNQQIYWYPTGRSRLLGQLPAIWLVAEHRWIPRRAAVMHPPGQPVYSETGAWNGICVACHTTNGRPGFDTPLGSQPIGAQAAETTAAEFGIACEGCHGPGSEHARLNRNPQRRYWFHLTGRADKTIVQPARLSARASSQVCGQCHAFWEFYDANGEREANWNGLPYRPGDELTATRFLVQPTKNLDSPTLKTFLEQDPGFVSDIFWSDGMVRATGREYNGLIESPCYKNAIDERRTLACSSCHTMHQTADDSRPVDVWADDQLARHASGNEACLQCHPAFRTKLSSHTKHRSDSPGSSCYNCHMPYTTYGLLKTIRSHQISNPSVRSTLETGRPNSCNLCHLDKTLEWTAQYLERWYGARPVPLSDDDRTIAASVLQLLKGDAGQRAIAAQSMGWAPAQQASGTSWIAPYLALLLTDGYDAVRFIAARSLRTLPGYGEVSFDFVAPPEQRVAFRGRALEIWRDRRVQERRRTDAALLMNDDGTFKASIVDRLLRERDNRRVVYRE